MKSTLALSLICGSLVLLVGGCATIVENKDFAAFQEVHREVAILPFQVNVALRKIPEDFDESMLDQQERDESYAFQEEFFTQLSKKQLAGEYTVQFQDIERTNVLLKRAGIDYDNLDEYMKDEIASILGVDSVIGGTIHRSKPMGTGAAIFTTLVFGFGVTNEVNVNVTIHDGRTGELLWNFDNEFSGGLGVSSERLAESLIKQISRKFPYEVPSDGTVVASSSIRERRAQEQRAAQVVDEAAEKEASSIVVEEGDIRTN